MPDYDFKSLSSFDFECLVRELLSKALGYPFEAFTSGRDKGIDLRYSLDPVNIIIVQCKHYVSSRINTLISHLRTDEAPKVAKLKPNRYIIATSLGLTPDNKAEIQKIFKPWIKSPQDIYGRDDLNGVLKDNPTIEKNNFKLYLPSIAVLEKILHSGLYNRSRQRLAEVNEKARIYVQNESFGKAVTILDQSHVCIITGIPGIGKTTLAEMLILHYLNEGYELYDITQDVKEIDSVDIISQKTLLFFDDFLGQTSLSEKMPQNADDRLIRLIRSVEKSTTCRFILTTRDYLLAQAQQVYERLDRCNLESHKFVLDLSLYAPFIKAKILYNHVYFSDLSTAWKLAIAEKKTYSSIIEHPNFNPRLIQGVIETARTECHSAAEFADQFISVLDNPAQLWKHPFERQLSDDAQAALLVLCTLPLEADVNDLEIAFSSYIGKPASARAWKDLLRILEGNFITFDSFLLIGPKAGKAGQVRLVSIHNPSLRDFLIDYLQQTDLCVHNLVERSVFFHQCISLWKYAIRQWPGNWKSPPEITIAYALKRHSKKFMEKLISTFTSPECVFQTVRYSNDLDVRKYRTGISLEERFNNAIKIFIKLSLNSRTTKLWLKKTMNELVSNWGQGKVDKNALVSLLETISDSDCWSFQERGNIAIATGKCCICSLDTDDDYDIMLNFSSKFPDAFFLISTYSATQDAQSFVNSGFNYIRFDANSSSAEDTFNRIQKIIELFDLRGFEIQLSEARDRIDQLEDESSAPEIQQPTKNPLSYLDVRSTVDSLFDSLRSDLSNPRLTGKS